MSKHNRRNPAGMVINPAKLSDAKLRRMKEYIKKGWSAQKIADKIGCKAPAVRRYAKAWGFDNFTRKSKKSTKKKTTTKRSTSKKKTTTKKTTKSANEKVSKKSTTRKSTSAKSGKKGTIVLRKINHSKRKGTYFGKPKTLKTPYAIFVNPKKDKTELVKSLLFATGGFILTKLIAGGVQSAVINVLKDKYDKKHSETATTENETGVNNEVSDAEGFTPPVWAELIAPLVATATVGVLGFSKIGEDKIPHRSELVVGSGIASVAMILKSGLDYLESKGKIKNEGFAGMITSSLGDNAPLTSKNDVVVVVPDSALHDYVVSSRKALPKVVSYNPIAPSVNDYIPEVSPEGEISDYIIDKELSDYIPDNDTSISEPNVASEYEVKEISDAPIDDPQGEFINDPIYEDFEEFEEPPML